MCAWLIGHAIDHRVQDTFHWYLTNWAEVIHVFYLLTAFISSMYGYVKSPQKADAPNNNASTKTKEYLAFPLHLVCLILG